MSAAELTADNVPANKTLLVLGDLAVTSTVPTAAGDVKVEGRLVFTGDASIATWPTAVDYSQAILKNSATARSLYCQVTTQFAARIMTRIPRLPSTP